MDWDLMLCASEDYAIMVALAAENALSPTVD